MGHTSIADVEPSLGKAHGEIKTPDNKRVESDPTYDKYSVIYYLAAEDVTQDRFALLVFRLLSMSFFSRAGSSS